MDIIKLLEYFEEILETSSKIPMSNKIIVNKKELMEILEKIVDNLPDEFKKASWICSEKEKIINDAEEQAEKIKMEAIELMKTKINNHEIIKEAEDTAKKIISTTQKKADAINKGTKEYSLDLLGQVAESLNTVYFNYINDTEKEMEGFRNNMDTYMKKMNSDLKENIGEIEEL